jgi:hypothetical protein
MKYIKLFENNQCRMPKFNVGEIVICVDDEESFNKLKYGKKYKIIKINTDNLYPKYILKDVNNPNGFWEERFVHEWEWEAKKYNL